MNLDYYQIALLFLPLNDIISLQHDISLKIRLLKWFPLRNHLLFLLNHHQPLMLLDAMLNIIYLV